MMHFFIGCVFSWGNLSTWLDVRVQTECKGGVRQSDTNLNWSDGHCCIVLAVLFLD